MIWCELELLHQPHKRTSPQQPTQHSHPAASLVGLSRKVDGYLVRYMLCLSSLPHLMGDVEVEVGGRGPAARVCAERLAALGSSDLNL